MKRQLLVMAALLILTLWVAAASVQNRPLALLFDDLHWTLAALVAVGFVLSAVGEASLAPVLRRARLWFLAGMGALLAGQLVFDLQEAVGFESYTTPADLLFVLIGPAYTVGFTILLRESVPAGQRRVVLLDVAAFACALTALLIPVFQPYGEHISGLDFTVLVAYPIPLFTAFAAAQIAQLHLRQRWSASGALLMTAMFAQGCIWTISSLRGLDGPHSTPGSLLSLCFSVVALVQGWATYLWKPDPDTSRRFDRFCEGALRLVPLMVVGLAATALAVLATRTGLKGGLEAAPLGFALTAVALAVIRQTQQLGERDRLIDAERELAESRAKLHYLAHHDALTGLPNRALLKERALQALDRGTATGARTACLYIDLDHFKEVNDTYGHATGDALLCEVGQRLTAALHWSDTVSRQGGDEFTVLLTEVREVADVVRATEKVMALSATTVAVNGYELPLSMSVGIALYPDDALDFPALLQHADTAMYRAKAAGRNGYRFYDAQMQEDTSSRMQLRSALSHALDRHELRLLYQPVIELGRGRICGAEALLRWSNPSLGEISPARFIPVAEESGLIVEIGAWVLEEACRQAAAWRAKGLEVAVAVNVSVLQFRRGNFHDLVVGTLGRSGLPPQLLELELTESVLMQDRDRVAATIETLGRLGVGFAIDDFGTGFSSLGYLNRLRVGKVKIDKSFVQSTVGARQGSTGLVQAIIRMAHALKVIAVAEGVETAEQRELLAQCGCDMAQGYWFSAPLDPAAFERLVSERAAGHAPPEVITSF